MVDSLNLKKRILKMREAHNSYNGDNNLNSSRVKNSEQHNIFNKNALFSHLDTSKKKLFDNNIARNDYKKQNFSSVLNHKNEENINYDEQFKLLANKFNEAIEVILELSERVHKLENIIYSKKQTLNKNKYSNNGYKLKLIVFIFFITLCSFYLLFLPVDYKSTGLFLDDILLLLQ